MGAISSIGACSSMQSCYGGRGTALGMALGGSSDVIGVLAYGRALGFSCIVLVQPGSPPRGATPPSRAQSEMVSPLPGPAPGGDFFDNPSMVAYLLGNDLDMGGKVGYYLHQPKDDGKGFSQASLEQTTVELIDIATRHRCTAIIGLDFGGDVALPEKKKEGGPFIQERDRLNFRASKAAATKLGIEINMVAVAPGIDGAGVAPTYNEAQAASRPPKAVEDDVARRRCSDSVLEMKEKKGDPNDTPVIPSFEMNGEGKLCPLDTNPPECTLPTLPQELFEHRLIDVEEPFMRELRLIASTIIQDTPDAKRKEHASKTYHMLSCIGSLAENDKEFFALGRFRSSEHSRAHMHSSYAMGIYSLQNLEKD